jgi:hypothetical protein
MPSIVAEIGAVVEDHLKQIGLLHDPEMSPEQRRLIAEKRAAYEHGSKKNKPDPDDHGDASVGAALAATSSVGAASAANPSNPNGPEPYAFPPTATLCPKCSTKAVIIMDGCATCLNCGQSKCG